MNVRKKENDKAYLDPPAGNVYDVIQDDDVDAALEGDEVCNMNTTYLSSSNKVNTDSCHKSAILWHPPPEYLACGEDRQNFRRDMALVAATFLQSLRSSTTAVCFKR
jgi:hypothetical protein